MTDIAGPADALNFVTQRPNDGRVYGANDTWFKDCTTPFSQDGTQVEAAWLNQIVGFHRQLIRANGLKADGVNPVVSYDNADDMILRSMLALIQRGRANFGLDQGAVNALSVDLPVVPAELLVGMTVTVQIENTNTSSAVTLAVNGLSGAVKKYDGSNPEPGDLAGNTTLPFRWDGAQWRVPTLLASDIAELLNATTVNQTFINNLQSQLLPAPRLIATFAAAGPFTFNRPAWMRYAFVEQVSGGAGGTSGLPNHAGGGGGGGAYSSGVFDLSALPEVSGVNGYGGAGGTGSGQFGQPGGSSTFSTFMSIPGAQIQTTGVNGTLSTGQAGAARGTGGDINLPGGYGGDGAGNGILGGNGGNSNRYGLGGRAGNPSGADGNGPGAGGGAAYDGAQGTTPGTGGSGQPGATFIWGYPAQ